MPALSVPDGAAFYFYEPGGIAMREKKKVTFAEAAPLKATDYERFAQYYETDQMGIIHHSNYVRWMEEARVHVMEQIGFGYYKMENMGILCPVLGVSTEYKQMVRFNERVIVRCRIAEYTGLKLTMLYEIVKKDTGELCTLGETRHGFLDREGRIISLKRNYPEIHQLILDSMILPEPEE